MALWWLCGGCVFPVVVKPEILTFKVKFDLEGHDQSPAQTTWILTNAFCTSGPNLVFLAGMREELWCGQAQNGVNFYSYRADKQMIDSHTDPGKDNTREPKLASGKIQEHNMNKTVSRVHAWRQ